MTKYIVPLGLAVTGVFGALLIGIGMDTHSATYAVPGIILLIGSGLSLFMVFMP